MVSECEGRKTIKIQERPVLSGLSHVDGLVSFEIVSGRGGHDRREKFDARMGLEVERGNLKRRSLSFEKMRAT